MTPKTNKNEKNAVYNDTKNKNAEAANTGTNPEIMIQDMDLETESQNLANNRRPSISSIASCASNGSIESRKRKRLGFDPDVIAPEANALADFEQVVNHLMEKLSNLVKDSKTNRRQIEIVEKEIPKFRKVYTALSLENVALRSRIQQMENNVAPMKSYRDVLANANKQTKTLKIKGPAGSKITPSSRHTLLIQSTEPETETPDSIKDKLYKNINPLQDNVRIKSVRKAKTAVYVETESEEDLKKIINNPALQQCNLQATRQKKRLPRLIIYDVPSEIEEEQVKSHIFNQNSNLNDFDHNELKLSFKTGPKDKPNVHWVIEVTPSLRNLLCKLGKLFIGWHRCKVADFNLVSRCYKCQGLGHISKYCTRQVDTCGKCKSEGHNHKNCKANKENKKLCIPCKRANKPCDHAMDNKCPTYRILLERLIANTDYDINV